MAPRVLFGNRGGENGVWVSRPGVSVLSTSDDQLLLSSTRRSAQVIASGGFGAAANSSYAISWPYNLGFLPIILAGSARFSVAYTHNSLTSATLTTGQYENFGFWITNNQPNPPAEVRWSVLNIPQ